MFEATLEQIAVIRQTLAPLRVSNARMMQLMFLRIVAQMSTFQLVFTAAIAVASLALLLRTRRPRRRGTQALGLPVVSTGTNRELDFDSMLHEGAARYPGQLYVIQSSTWDYVVCPSQMFDEVKRLPAHTASLQAYFESTTFGHYTHIGHESPAMFTSIQLDLARASPAQIRARQAICKDNCDRYLGVCDDWTPFEILPVFFKIVARMNASALMGRNAGDTDLMATLLMRFLVSIMLPVMLLNKCPAFLIPVLPQPLFLWHRYVCWCLRRLLEPVIRDDMAAFNASPEKAQDADQGRVPFTAWLLARHQDKPKMERLILDYLLALFEATPSTSSTLYSVLFDLAAHPEAVDILREEIREVAPDGELPLSHLHELHKMDSVMRESFRSNAFSLFALHRRLMKPVQLSVGPPLPAGTYICVDAHSIYKSPQLWSNPNAYDPLRFHKLRKGSPENEERYRFITSDGRGPAFGGGTQGCPGRVWASSTIKILLTHLLMNYDFKLRPGDGLPKRTCMPNGTKAPDFKAQLLFKSRQCHAFAGI